MLSTTLTVKTAKHPLSTVTQTYWLTMLCWDITEITNIMDATLTMMSMIFTLPWDHNRWLMRCAKPTVSKTNITTSLFREETHAIVVLLTGYPVMEKLQIQNVTPTAMETSTKSVVEITRTLFTTVEIVTRTTSSINNLDLAILETTNMLDAIWTTETLISTLLWDPNQWLIKFVKTTVLKTIMTTLLFREETRVIVVLLTGYPDVTPTGMETSTNYVVEIIRTQSITAEIVTKTTSSTKDAYFRNRALARIGCTSMETLVGTMVGVVKFRFISKVDLPSRMMALLNDVPTCNIVKIDITSHHHCREVLYYN